MKEHLNEYFVKSLRATGKQVDHDLCLLCVQCFEVSKPLFALVAMHGNSLILYAVSV